MEVVHGLVPVVSISRSQAPAWERKFFPKLCLGASLYYTQPIKITKNLSQAEAWEPAKVGAQGAPYTWLLCHFADS
jgi:hypothetical protein